MPEKVILPARVTPMIVGTDTQPWHIVLREAISAELNEKHDRLHAETVSRVDRTVSAEFARLQQRIEELESRWYNRLAVWMRSLFN